MGVASGLDKVLIEAGSLSHHVCLPHHHANDATTPVGNGSVGFVGFG